MRDDARRVRELRTKVARGPTFVVPLASSRMSLRAGLLAAQEVEVKAHFDVKQDHLGFCPEDVILEIRVETVALCDDARMVVEYPFENLVMWSQHQNRVTLMTQDNLRRIVLRARNTRDAKKIGRALTDQAEAIVKAKEKRAREALEQATSSGDMKSSGDSKRPAMTASGDQSSGKTIAQQMTTSDDDHHMPTLDFRPEIGADLEEFRAFPVQQSHLLPSVTKENTVVLRIDWRGVTLCSRFTGEQHEHTPWLKLLMWKADDKSVVLVLTSTNKQVRLMTAAAEDVSRALVQFSKSVKASMELRNYQVGFRKELLTFEPVKFKTQEAWSKAKVQGSLLSKLLPWGGTENLAESLQTRDQLHAVFAMHDKNANGVLDKTELKSLLKSINMQVTGAELQEIMDDMESNPNDEIEFDSFVKWVLSSEHGAKASGTLRRRIAHKKKEVDALLLQFEMIDEDGELSPATFAHAYA